MDWLQAIVLGLVQGLTEFLPISSSAHLRVVSTLGWGTDAGAAFTAVSQLGTELAVLIYYAKTIGPLVATWFKGIFSAEARRTEQYRIAWYVIIGSVPITLLGVAFQDQIKSSLRNLWMQGALVGNTPEEAFYILCDETNNPASSVDEGKLIVDIGIAPVKPAEFVIFRLSQWQGGAETSD
ncbi:undecaprenyl-diphosphate phosphatase [Kibdelosporangium lantanae]|uniref:Undecaprenyl-diphosphatase n=1 Tax=Kibdelosporangium lantanae TaxID=1497396 RepID=A0ABW3M662_9PSEU